MIALFTKLGGLETGCSVGRTGGGNRAFSLIFASLLQNCTKLKKSIFSSKIYCIEYLLTRKAEIAKSGIRYNGRILSNTSSR